MKVCVLFLVLASSILFVQGSPENAFDFVTGAFNGARDMHKAYSDMREANWRNSDKYFHARGNQDAARHGAGGRWAARTISNVRELADRLRGQSALDSATNQAANRVARNGGNIDIYRPRGLPLRY